MAKKVSGELIPAPRALNLSALEAVESDRPSASTVSAALQHLGLKDYSEQACIAIGGGMYRTVEDAGYSLGLACMLLKANTPNDQAYGHAVAEMGLKSSTARLYAARARFLAETGQGGKFSALGGSRIDQARKALTSRGVSVAELLDEEGRIAGLSVEDIQGMKPEEFSAHLQDAVSDNIDLQEKVEAKDAEISKLKLQVDNAKLDARNAKAARARLARLEMPEWSQTARHEGSAMCEQMRLSAQHLRKVKAEHLERHINAVEDEDRQHADSAAGHIYYGLSAVRALIDALQSELAQDFPEAVRGLMPAHELTVEERADAELASRVIFLRHQTEAKNRETERKLNRQRTHGGAGRRPNFVSEE